MRLAVVVLVLLVDGGPLHAAPATTTRFEANSRPGGHVNTLT